MSELRLLAVHQGGGIGGAPVSLLKLLSRLDSHTFQGRAVFTDPGPILGYARELGVRASTVQTGGAFFYSAHAQLEVRSLARFLSTFPGAVQSARTFLRQERPDLIHLNTSVLLAWAAAARREGVPVVWVVREVLGPNPVVRQWHARFITAHARRTVAVSDAVRACFSPGSNLVRVYNAVDLDEFAVPTVAASQAMKRELGLDPSRQVVMAIGSVQRAKGHWLLLEALPHLPATAHLVLVTGGVEPAYAHSARGRVKRVLGLPLDNLDAWLREAAQLGLTDRVHITGFRRDIARVLAAADVLAFPSLAAEGFGRPIIEAMALARPVVATDVGPSAELLGPHAGRLVPPDAVILAEALSELLRQPAERARLGHAGRQRVEACFDLEQQIGAMSGVYRQAVGLG